MTFWGVYQASCGRIPMKIGGNQAGAFPDLPIQPRNLDVNRKILLIALELFMLFSPKTVLSDKLFMILTTVLV